LHHSGDIINQLAPYPESFKGSPPDRFPSLPFASYQLTPTAHQQAVEKPSLGEVVILRGERGLPSMGLDDDIAVLPPVVPREVRSTFSGPATETTEADLLEELKRLPPAWFDELVFHFDANSAVSARPASQATRAIDLLTVVRVQEDGPARLRDQIQRLKGKRR
jgi:hypothetical protein